ncbi:MAG: hypothetical protein DRP62_07245, partial [Planctomycetota bacterium]
VAYYPEHRLVVTVVPGKRTAKNVKKLVFDFKKRTDGRRLDRSYLVFARMADLSGCSIDIRYEANLPIQMKKEFTEKMLLNQPLSYHFISVLRRS